MRTSEAIEEKKNRGGRKEIRQEEERRAEQERDQSETTQAETENGIPEIETETEPEFWELETEPFSETIPETERKGTNGYGPGFEIVPETNGVTTESQTEIQSQPEPELQTEASTCWRRGLEK